MLLFTLHAWFMPWGDIVWKWYIGFIYKLYIFPPFKYSIVLKFIYSEKATKFCEIFPLLLTVCTVVKIKGKISQNFVAFSEYMNFTEKNDSGRLMLVFPFCWSITN